MHELFSGGDLQPCQGTRQERRWFLLPLLVGESKKGMVAQELHLWLFRDSLVSLSLLVSLVSCVLCQSACNSLLFLAFFLQHAFMSGSSTSACLIPDSWSLRVKLLHCRI